ncbi:hypothetical protein OS493_033797 [Desmophyllum pertusum]|uniref:Uncharacterized protein n=1 Tax=Desmophyllum pertusum TaxID=174260 RepID=A0A9W9YVD9_9CNID|nr:hypothetical protein OS493_033797 [Desmophyllum pertusum]
MSSASQVLSLYWIKRNCSEYEISNTSSKQTVCGPDADRCAKVYYRFNKTTEQFIMNCTHRNICNTAIESCQEAMRINPLDCCNVMCCDSDFVQ